MKTLEDFQKFNKNNPIAKLIRIFDEYFYLLKNSSDYWYHLAENIDNIDFEDTDVENDINWTKGFNAGYKKGKIDFIKAIKKFQQETGYMPLTFITKEEER